MTAVESAIQNIAEYEFSVDREASLRLTQSDAGRLMRAPGVTDEQLLVYGEKCVDYLRFGYDLEVLMDTLSLVSTSSPATVRSRSFLASERPTSTNSALRSSLPKSARPPKPLASTLLRMSRSSLHMTWHREPNRH